jgi:dipeptidyl aminopeptidase/acylaminoacyl peptidase
MRAIPPEEAVMASGPIDPSIVVDLDTVAEAAISPDGGTVAYVRGSVDADSLRRSSHLETVGFEGGSARRVTTGPLDSRPTWSPDGAQLAFLRSHRKDDGETTPPQLWVLPSGGGGARQLTDFAGPVRSIAWLPDSSAVIAAADVDPDEPDSDADDSIPVAKRVNRIYYRADGLGWRGDAHRQLFRVDAGGEAADARGL